MEKVGSNNRSGGAAPYGYRRTAGGGFEPEPTEAPIRKLIFELFIAHKRKLVVAKKLNSRGYRTRSGAKFSDSSIDRFLRDPIVTGHHKDNFLPAKGQNKYATLKPESEWKFPPIAQLVDQETWEQAQMLLAGQKSKPVAKPPKAIFADYLYCTCGAKMHRPHGRRSYQCSLCDTSIEAKTLEAIFQQKLTDFPIQENLISEILQNRKSEMKEFPQSENLRKEKRKLESEADKLYDLYINDSISKKRFLAKYNPLEERINQIDTTLEAINTAIQEKSHFGQFFDQSMMKTYGDMWGLMPHQSKRQLVEIITQRIDVGSTNIKIAPLIPTLLRQAVLSIKLLNSL